MAKQKLKLGEHETEYESLSEEETRKLVGEELDSRFAKLEIPASLDADKLKTDILGEVTSLFEKHEAKPMDEDAFFKRMEKSIDLKLKGFTPGEKKEREPGWLTRLLFS